MCFEKKEIRPKRNFIHYDVKSSIKVQDLWRTDDQWENRHVVFEMMKKQFDINLFHENK